MRGADCLAKQAYASERGSGCALNTGSDMSSERQEVLFNNPTTVSESPDQSRAGPRVIDCTNQPDFLAFENCFKADRQARRGRSLKSLLGVDNPPLPSPIII